MKLPKKAKEAIVPVNPLEGITRRSVYLSVPSIDGKMTVALAQCIVNWAVTGALGTSPHGIFFMPKIGHSPVEHARNLIVKDFLETDLTHLWMIDDDTVTFMQTVRMLDDFKDLVIAPVPMFISTDDKVGSLTYNVFHQREDGSVGLWMDGMEPYAGGTGCIAIARHVLEDPRMQIPGAENPWEVFRTLRKPSGEVTRGEDMDFVLRARELGYDFKVSWPARCDHMKQLSLGHYATSILNDHGKQSKAYKGLVDSLGDSVNLEHLNDDGE